MINTITIDNFCRANAEFLARQNTFEVCMRILPHLTTEDWQALIRISECGPIKPSTIDTSARGSLLAKGLISVTAENITAELSPTGIMLLRFCNNMANAIRFGQTRDAFEARQINLTADILKELGR
jgi:hypothetical protein